MTGEQCKFLLREEGQAGTPVLAREDGSLTGNLKEIDDLLHKFWGPIFKQYATRTAPCPTAFKQKYGRYIPRAEPMTRQALTPTALAETLKRASSSSSVGVDGWSYGDLKLLPQELLRRLCELFELIEETGTWPSAIAQGLISAVPKDGGGLDAAHIRPHYSDVPRIPPLGGHAHPGTHDLARHMDHRSSGQLQAMLWV